MYCAGFLFWREKILRDGHMLPGTARRAVPLRPYEESQREGEHHKVAFAGEDYGQEAAVRRDIEFADRDAAEDWLRRGCENGDVFDVFLRRELGNIYPHDVAGFSFDGAFQKDAIFLGRPMENAQAYAQADEVIGRGQVANFQDFSVDEIRYLFSAG